MPNTDRLNLQATQQYATKALSQLKEIDLRSARPNVRIQVKEWRATFAEMIDDMKITLRDEL